MVSRASPGENVTAVLAHLALPDEVPAEEEWQGVACGVLLMFVGAREAVPAPPTIKRFRSLRVCGM